jgi:hypothetical protein
MITQHALWRAAQRGLRPEILTLVLAYGRHAYSHGDQVRFLGRRDLPPTLAPDLARRAEGWTAILTPNGTIKTVFRNPKFWALLKKRPTLLKGHSPCKYR